MIFMSVVFDESSGKYLKTTKESTHYFLSMQKVRQKIFKTNSIIINKLFFIERLKK